MESDHLREISVNSFFITTPKIGVSRTLSSINDRANTTCHSTSYQPWAKPLILQLNIGTRQNSEPKKQNFIKKRKLISTLKYKKVIGDKMKRDSIKQQTEKTKLSIDRLRCISLSKTNTKLSTDLLNFVSIQTMKKTLKDTCQSRPIRLQTRPFSSSKKICRTQSSQQNFLTPKYQAINRRLKTLQKHKDQFDFISGW